MSTADPGIIDVAARDRFLHRIRNDFEFFLLELWKELKYNRRAPLDRIELDMAKWVAYGPQFRGVLGFRGCGKSYFGSAGFAAYRLRQDAERKIVITSGKLDSMSEVVGLVREWTDRVWWLNDLAPRRGRLDTSTAFDVELAGEHKQPSIKAVGIMGTLESNRAHTVIGDDLETKKNTKTRASQDTLHTTVQEAVHILYPDLSQVDKDDPDIVPALFPPEVVLFGTVKCENTLYLKLSDENGYEFRTYPICYPTPEEVKGALGMAPILIKDMERGFAVYNHKRYPTSPGSPTIPRRFGEEEVLKRRCGILNPATGKRKGGVKLSEWLMEYQLQVNLSIAMPFKLKLRDLMVMAVDRNKAPIHLTWGLTDDAGSTAIEGLPSLGHGDDRCHRPAHVDSQLAPFTGTKGFIDPAGRGEDKTGLAIISHLGGFLYVKCVIGLDGGFDPPTLEKLAQLLRQHGATEVYCERNYGGGMFDTLLEPVLQRHAIRPGTDPLLPGGWSCGIVDDTKLTQSFAQKEVRLIGILESATSQHRMVWDHAVAQNLDLQHQYTRIRAEKGSLGFSPNELDALASCTRVWDYALALDPEKQRKRLSKKPDEQEFQRIHDFLHGKGRVQIPKANWLRNR